MLKAQTEGAHQSDSLCGRPESRAAGEVRWMFNRKATIKYNKRGRNKKKNRLCPGQQGRTGAVCVMKGRANICDSDHITRAELRF